MCGILGFASNTAILDSEKLHLAATILRLGLEAYKKIHAVSLV